jgi:hypothetical protein
MLLSSSEVVKPGLLPSTLGVWFFLCEENGYFGDLFRREEDGRYRRPGLIVCRCVVKVLTVQVVLWNIYCNGGTSSNTADADPR